MDIRLMRLVISEGDAWLEPWHVLDIAAAAAADTDAAAVAAAAWRWRW